LLAPDEDPDGELGRERGLSGALIRAEVLDLELQRGVLAGALALERLEAFLPISLESFERPEPARGLAGRAEQEPHPAIVRDVVRQGGVEVTDRLLGGDPDRPLQGDRDRVAQQEQAHAGGEH
jgi:hypothetical protein